MTLNISNLDLSGKNIVIVEDDLPSVRYYETLLKNSGASVLVCHTGKEFVDYIVNPENHVDLVFMDFLVPLINGIECVRIFRKEHKSTPVLMVTAYSSEQAKTEAFIAGCSEYLLKPVYPEKIFALLEKYLISRVSVPHLY
jgi:DNA-binding response OmpR family regulator